MLEVYYYENSICAERVLMTLREKDIRDWVPHHLHLFKGEHFTPEYLRLNPKGVVPTLVHDGEIVRESAIICDYLDDIYTANPLKPQLALKRAQRIARPRGGRAVIAIRPKIKRSRRREHSPPHDGRTR
jgi:ganglioside-induced differentiation-associated protein 1